jgi:hypothetical protein
MDIGVPLEGTVSAAPGGARNDEYANGAQADANGRPSV